VVDRSEALKDWRAALQGAVDIPFSVAGFDRVKPSVPSASALYVGPCGSQCGGTYCQHSRSADYVLGPAYVTFVEELGLWCLLANVYATFPLEEVREIMGLKKHWEGPQLLYACRESAPSGAWVPILGEYPPPKVCTTADAIAMPRPVFGVRAPSTSPFVRPDLCRSILDLLSNLDLATWCKVGRWTATSLEIAVLIEEVLRDSTMASRVCRSWYSALQAAGTASGVRRLLQLDRAVNVQQLASIRQAVRVLRLTARAKPQSLLSLTQLPAFATFAWAASIHEVKVAMRLPEGSSRDPGGTHARMLEGIAPQFWHLAKRLLSDMPLAWCRYPNANGFESRRGESYISLCLAERMCAPTELHNKAELLCRVAPGGAGSALFRFDGGEVASGEQLREAAQGVLTAAFQLESIRSGWASTCNDGRHFPREQPLARCDRCRVSKPLRCSECGFFRGWEMLFAEVEFVFSVTGRPGVHLQISAACLPFRRNRDDDQDRWRRGVRRRLRRF